MAYLGKYIREMLSKKELVIFPGFGSLQITQGKGTVSPDGKIEPPGAVIRFDATHPKGDGRLSEAYAQGENLDPDEARQQVLELTDAIKFKLDKGEIFFLEGVGTFNRDDDNRIHFEKDPNWVIDPSIFGLSTLDLLELDHDTETEAAQEASGETAADKTASGKTTSGKTVEGEIAKRQKSSAKSKTEANSGTDQPKRPDPSKVRKPVNKWRIIWIVVGSLAAVLILLLLIPTGGESGIEFGKEGIVLKNMNSGDSNSGISKESGITSDAEEQTKGTSSKNVIPGLEKDTDEAGSSGAADQTETDRGQEMNSQPANRYFIIAGSFQNLANAQELMNSLKDRGFPAEVLITENRLYRVSVQSYSTKDGALEDLARVKSSSGLSSCWVMTR